MKSFFYVIYSVFFHLFRVFGVKENRVTLLSPHNANFKDSLLYVRNEFSLRGDFRFYEISGNDLKSAGGIIKFFLVKSYYLATSKYIFLNDTFMPMSKLRFSKKAVIVQLWHGQGILKKFIMDTKLDETVRKNAKKCADKYTYIVASSKNIIPVWSGAFGADENKFLPFGQPATDCFYGEMKTKLFEKYPEIKGKKLILYAPTFRDNAEEDKEIFNNFNIDFIKNRLGDEYALLVRLHPQIHTSVPGEGCIDVTGYDDVNELIKECHILITDYSSICMEFSMLCKPMLFFAYDLEKYKDERDLYFDYEEYVPGKVVKTVEELTSAIMNEDFDKEKNESFRKFNFDYLDVKSTKRLVDFLLGEKG